jgi:hypothetical protein
MYIEGVRASLLLLCFALAGCSPQPPDPAQYLARVAAERDRKDAMFRGGEDSPVRASDRDRFLPLSYFDIDEAYAVPAELEPARERIVFTMPTSTGKLRNVELIGTLKFSLRSQPMQLTAFLEEGSRRLFVPFSDLTSGAETYSAGRYMNLDPTPSGIYIVDFNIAYNPYCYYNAEYDGPLPPAENRLTAPIRAGERLAAPDVSLTR